MDSLELLPDCVPEPFHPPERCHKCHNLSPFEYESGPLKFTTRLSSLRSQYIPRDCPWCNFLLDVSVKVQHGGTKPKHVFVIIEKGKPLTVYFDGFVKPYDARYLLYTSYV